MSQLTITVTEKGITSVKASVTSVFEQYQVSRLSARIAIGLDLINRMALEEGPGNIELRVPTVAVHKL